MTGRRPNSRGDDFDFGDLEYADDTAVLFDSLESALVDAPGIDSHFFRFGMEVHAGDYSTNKDSKTEILYVTTRSSTNQPPRLKEINVYDTRFFPVVDSFSYLGTLLTSKGSSQNIRPKIRSIWANNSLKIERMYTSRAILNSIKFAPRNEFRI